jgi:hypothetical protein
VLFRNLESPDCKYSEHLPNPGSQIIEIACHQQSLLKQPQTLPKQPNFWPWPFRQIITPNLQTANQRNTNTIASNHLCTRRLGTRPSSAVFFYSLPSISKNQISTIRFASGVVGVGDLWYLLASLKCIDHANNPNTAGYGHSGGGVPMLKSSK